VALNQLYGPEPKEGIASFQEKRPADWRKFREGEGPDPATPSIAQAKKEAAKQAGAKKPAATKGAAASASKATTAKKPAAKRPAAKKPAAKKPAPRMTSATTGSTGGRKATTGGTGR